MLSQVEKSSRHRSKWIKAWPAWLFGLALLLVLTTVILHRSNERNFLLLMKQARPFLLLLGILLQAGTYFSEALLWRQVLRTRRIEIPFFSYVGLSFSKLFMDQALPSGGLSGSLMILQGLKKKGISHETAISALSVSMAAYYAAYLLSLLLSLGILWGMGDLTQLILVPAALFALFSVSALAFFLTNRRSGAGGLAAFWRHIPFVKRLAEIFAAARPEMTRNPSLLIQGSLLQLAIFLLDGATVWAMVRAVGTRSSLFAVFPSYMVASLARTMGIMPGGLGTFEAASVGTLRVLGVPLSSAYAATLLYRGLSFWIPMLPGLYFTQRASRRLEPG